MASDYQSAYRNVPVLVTGGAGAIGGNLCRALTELGAKVTILDDLSSSFEWNLPGHANIEVLKGDVLDAGARAKAMRSRPRIIYHLAALFANQNSIDHIERDLMVNGMGTLAMLEEAKSAAVTRFVYASSGCSVYGNESPLPLREEFMSMRLSTPYQITKMLGELYGNFFHEHYKVPVVKARMFNSFGPGEVPGQYRNVIPNFIYWAMEGKPLPITGSGDETRDFTFVADLVDGLLRAGVMEEAVGQDINLASGKETRIREVAEMINEMTGNRGGITFIPRRDWDSKSRLLASVERAERLLGYRPRTDFASGLKQTFSWFRENWESIRSSSHFGKVTT